MRAAVVMAPPVSARSSLARVGRAVVTTSPVAIPMRTSSGSVPSPRSASAARMPSPARTARIASSSWTRGQPKTAKTASPMNFSRVPSKRSMTSPIAASATADPLADVLGIVLGDHPDVADQVREERGHDPAVTGLARHLGRPRSTVGPAARERDAASIAEPGVGGRVGAARVASHSRTLPHRARSVATV